MRSKEKITIKWSRKGKCWIAKFPEWGNRNASILSKNLLSMINLYEEDMKKLFKNDPERFKSLYDYISEGGFDPETFSISVNAKIKS